MSDTNCLQESNDSLKKSTFCRVVRYLDAFRMTSRHLSHKGSEKTIELAIRSSLALNIHTLILIVCTEATVCSTSSSVV